MTKQPPPENSAVRHVTVSEEYCGQRLDNFLIRELKGAPKSLIYKVLRRGEVRVNKGRAKPERRLETGDLIRLPPIRLSEQGEPVPAAKGLLQSLEEAILYEDKGLLVINKPAGLAVHGGSGIHLGLIEALRQARPEEKSLELIHRLDRETSGCLLVAKKRSALRFLQDALREQQLDKRYLALVKGHWSPSRRLIESPLLKYTLPSGERRVRVSGDSESGAKAALTEFELLECFDCGDDRCSLVEAKPVTGRTHQIRVHAQSVGHPLVGDDKYTDDEFNQAMKKFGFNRLFLHAAELTFPVLSQENPDKVKTITVKAELPEALKKPLDALKVC